MRTPKNRALMISIFCFVCAIFCYFFINVNIMEVIMLIFASVVFLFAFLIFSKIDIRIADLLFFPITILTFFCVFQFYKIPILVDFSIKSFEKDIQNAVIQSCTEKCKLSYHFLYDSDNNRINAWYGFYNIDEGYAITDGDDISYQIKIETGCIKKDFGSEYVLTEGECDF